MCKARLRSLLLILVVFFSLMTVGCKYDIPDDATKNPHSYSDAIEYIGELYDNVVVSDDYREGESEYGKKYRVWDATYNEIDFVIISQQEWYWDSTGEFAKTRYTLRNNYDRHLLISLFEELPIQYENYNVRAETDVFISSIDYSFVEYSVVIDSEKDLLAIYEEIELLYNEITQYKPEARFTVIVNLDNSESSSLYISTFEKYGLQPFSEETYDRLLEEFLEYMSE